MQEISSVTYLNTEECIVYSLFKSAWEITSLSFFVRSELFGALTVSGGWTDAAYRQQDASQKLVSSSAVHAFPSPPVDLEPFLTTFRPVIQTLTLIPGAVGWDWIEGLSNSKEEAVEVKDIKTHSDEN